MVCYLTYLMFLSLQFQIVIIVAYSNWVGLIDFYFHISAGDTLVIKNVKLILWIVITSQASVYNKPANVLNNEDWSPPMASPHRILLISG